MNKVKRQIPSIDTLLQRKKYFEYIGALSPVEPPFFKDDLLDSGNNKTGYYGTKYNSILIWNLPPLLTCPAKTQWCLTHCYNADTDLIKYPLNKWLENWWLFENKREILQEKINNQIKLSPKPCAVRLHSSGDFFSYDYLVFWESIIKENKEVIFWGYTRSWVIPGISNELKKLNELENVNIFASWDKYMGQIPNDWKICVVCSNVEEVKEFERDDNYISCPEQFGLTPNCASCGLCMTKNRKNIIFIIH
ncbi:MAG: hypothetical protein LBE91_03035 [Tannerella sp.]|jgi:hypothetical protein|nr:hypothetical protein [Tannerella sp.]